MKTHHGIMIRAEKTFRCLLIGSVDHKAVHSLKKIIFRCHKRLHAQQSLFWKLFILPYAELGRSAAVTGAHILAQDFLGILHALNT
uniref:Uncharacterized protein n=1 Tax=Hyaloperonospora arabidopsidis (strain Emoy2) TaxID=559515 RepID=M4B7A7_HYAAE